MGYPDDFKIPVSDTQAYRQFGNSVVMPVVERVAKCVVEALTRENEYQPELVLTAGEKKPPGYIVKKTSDSGKRRKK